MASTVKAYHSFVIVMTTDVFCCGKAVKMLSRSSTFIKQVDSHDSLSTSGSKTKRGVTPSPVQCPPNQRMTIFEIRSRMQNCSLIILDIFPREHAPVPLQRLAVASCVTVIYKSGASPSSEILDPPLCDCL